MTKRRDIVAEIEEIRSRNQGFYPVTIPTRMVALASAFETTLKTHSEFLRYFPIGIIACIEGFFRSAIAQCIDSDEGYGSRAMQLDVSGKFKPDLELLHALSGRRISLGELLAHIIPLNGLGQIESVMSTLLGTSFLELIKRAYSRVDVEIYNMPPSTIIESSDEVFSHVEMLFRLRHIFVHELAEDFGVPVREDLSAALKSAVSFLNASAEVVGNLLHPNAPLTQMGMNQAAAEDLAITEQEIGDLYNRTSANPKLAACRSAWDDLQRRVAEYDASAYEGASISPLIYVTGAQSIAELHLAFVKRVMDQTQL